MVMGLSAGAAWIPVRPNMATFGAEVQRGVTTAGATGGSKFGKAFGSAAKVGLLAAGFAAIKSASGFIKFDDAMTSSLAIMDDISGPMRKRMEDAARAVGKTTRFSATQAAESYFFLASAGMSAKQAVGAMPAVAKFAAAGNFDLATATDLATDAQSALGLAVDNPRKNLKNLTRVTDVFVKANTLANTSVEQISEAMTNKAGAAMRSVGMDIEEGSAVLAAFADQGVKGAAAGTQFSIVLRDLQTKALKNKEAFKEAGVAVFDANGELRPMAKIVKDLEDRLGGMSDAEKKAELATMGFSDKSMSALTTLLGTSEAIAGYDKELRNAGGTTEKVADKQLKSFGARLDILKSKAADWSLTAGKGLVNAAFDIGEGFASGEAAGKGFSRIMSGVGAGASKVLGELGDRVMKVLRPAFEDISKLIEQDFLPAFRDVLPILKPIGTFLLKVIGGAVVGAIKGAIQILKGAIGIITGIFKLIKAVVTGDWKAAWSAIKQIAKGALDVIVGAIKVWFNLGILAIFKQGIKFLFKSWKGLWTGLKKLGTNALVAIRNLVSKAVGWVKNLFVKAIKGYVRLWTGLFKSIWQLAVTGWKVLRSAFGGALAAIRSVFSQAMGKLKGLFTGLWTSLKNTGSKIMTLVKETIPKAFRAGRDAIGKAWNGIKELAKKPVNFVIDTVYNNGIRGAFNTIADKIGASFSLPKVSTIGGAGGAGHAPPAITRSSGPNLADAAAAGGPLGWIKGLTGKAWKWLEGKFKSTVGGLLSGVGDTPFAQMTGGMTTKLAGSLIERIKSKFIGSDISKSGMARGKGPVLPGGSYRIGMPYLGYPGHYGADYPAAVGTSVRSLRGGIVSRSMSMAGSYGKHVFVDHPGGIQTRYAHLDSLGVRAGMEVSKGALLGRVGSTGNSTGPHLHFEYRRNGSPVNPAGLGIFDSGGKLPTGLSSVFNGTGKTEAVLTSQQWADMHALATRSAQPGVHAPINVKLPTTATPEAAADAAGARIVAHLTAMGV